MEGALSEGVLSAHHPHHIQPNTKSSRKHDNSCKLDTLQTYLETASSQSQEWNSLPPNSVSSKSLNSHKKLGGKLGGCRCLNLVVYKS